MLLTLKLCCHSFFNVSYSLLVGKFGSNVNYCIHVSRTTFHLLLKFFGHLDLGQFFWTNCNPYFLKTSLDILVILCYILPDLAFMSPMVIDFKGSRLMIIFYQFDCITFLPVTQTVTGKTESVVSYFFKLMLISGIFLLIKGATVIDVGVSRGYTDHHQGRGHP